MFLANAGSFFLKQMKELSEKRELFFEAMSNQPEDNSTDNSTENNNNTHVCSDNDVLLSDADYMMTRLLRLHLKEAYQFYNLHSWEAGFRIRHGTSQTNTKQDQRNMQQFECQRAGKPRKNQKKTTKCGCPARMRLLRCSTGGYYVKTLVGGHNHSLVESCGEKRHLFSHKSIDESTKDMVRHLREKNVSLSKVNCIMGSMHGSMSAVPFTKNALRSVCAEIAQDHLQDDVMKTMHLFKELSKDDPNFRFSVQLE